MSSLPYFKFGSSNFCTYCGDNAESIDHIIAVSSQTINRKRADKTIYGPTTHACQTCNSKLNNRHFYSFLKRCEFMHDYYDNKAKPIKWDIAELSKLDYSLRGYITQQNAKRQWFRWRADWFQSREFFTNLELIKFEPCLDPTSPKFNQELFVYFDDILKVSACITKSDSWNC